ncbi:thiamine-phosphate kinase [Gemmatimonas phototrophica]|uniref:thiamine-phosphate kinase n=1 Tax=Gemmatimonas phototrophica TaxID=1379270 RepID=UPI0006A6DB98|nr:thiamine-phosphate kinase [Gemmatimonas phototrophica]
MFNTHGSSPHAPTGNVSTRHGFRDHQTMGQGSEFDIIRQLMAQWGPLAVDIGDDAAVLPPLAAGRRVVSTDACVEGVHFVREWLTPFEVGARAAAAALSDLAAMGAAAECVLVALVVPPSWESELAAVADGLGDQVRRAGARIVGGNLSRGATFALTLTVIGVAERAVPRGGAQVGDLVVVTGRLGGPGAALEAFLGGAAPSGWARDRFAAPQPRLREGQALADAGASAMVDISDGLAADARHVGAASGVVLQLDPARVPVGPGVSPANALVSGEEYELLATIAPAAFEALAGRWAAVSGEPITVVGIVVAPDDTHLPPKSLPGHDHFTTR